MMQQLQNFYAKFNLKALDQRTQQEKTYQKDVASKICKQNQQIFDITLTSKKSIKYPISKIEKVELEGQQYCFITDNRINSEQTIITIHGAPGSHAEWAGLQTEMQNRYRWINFMIPGFDGEDQRRGIYKGDRPSLNLLFVSLVKTLELKRIIICAHSYGATIGFSIARQYPSLIQGFINIAGLTKNWQFGQLLIFKNIIYDHGYYKQEWKQKRLFNIDQERKLLYKKYSQTFKDGTFQFFKEYQFFAFLKLSFQSPQTFDQLLKDFSQDFPKLRVNIYGRQDPFIPPQIVEATIYQLIFNQLSYSNSQKFKNLLKIIKQPLEKKFFAESGNKFEGQRIQEYLNFVFDQTGHNIHRRRPKELSQILCIYLSSLQIIYEKQIILKSNL